MESIFKRVFQRRRERMERKAYNDNFVAASNCLGTTSKLFNRQWARVSSRDDLMTNKKRALTKKVYVDGKLKIEY